MKMKPFQTSQCTGAQTVVGHVEAEELGIRRYERQCTVEAVAPPAVLADELAASPRVSSSGKSFHTSLLPR